MLRSMLKVRYGSGCNRRVTASAARPSAGRSLHSNKSTASANDNRSPVTALSRIACTVIAELLAGKSYGCATACLKALPTKSHGLQASRGTRFRSGVKFEMPAGRGQPALHGQVVEPLQPGLLVRPEVKAEQRLQVP